VCNRLGGNKNKKVRGRDLNLLTKRKTTCQRTAENCGRNGRKGKPLSFILSDRGRRDLTSRIAEKKKKTKMRGRNARREVKAQVSSRVWSRTEMTVEWVGVPLNSVG